MYNEAIKELACRFFINTPWYRKILATTDPNEREKLIDTYKYDLTIQLTNCQYWCWDTKKYKWKKEYETQLLDFLNINNDELAKFLEENKKHNWAWDVPASGLVIFNKERTHILFLKSRNDVWTFPKGKVKGGISWKDSAISEGLEEVGVDFSKEIEDDPFILNKRKSKISYYPVFSDLDTSFTPQPLFAEEIRRHEWVSIDDNSLHICLDEIIGLFVTKEEIKKNHINKFIIKIKQWLQLKKEQ